MATTNSMARIACALALAHAFACGGSSDDSRFDAGSDDDAGLQDDAGTPADGGPASDGGPVDGGGVLPGLDALVLGQRLDGSISPGESQEIELEASVSDGYYVMDLEVADPGATLSVQCEGISVLSQRVTRLVRIWWAVQQGTACRAVLEGSAVASEELRFSATLGWNAADDPYEPNNASEDASLLSKGQAASAMVFSGYGASGPPSASSFFDWYEIALLPGSYSITLSGISDLSVDLGAVQDEAGTPITADFSSMGPSSISRVYEDVPGGFYRFPVRPLEPWFDLSAVGFGADMPAWFTQEYSVLVSPL